MAELDEVTRALVRRAYAGEPFDAEAGLAEVVRRAGRPPVEESTVGIERRHAVSVRRRRRWAMAGVFAGVAGLVLVVGVATGRLGGGDGRPVGAGPSIQLSPSGPPVWPSGMPTPTISNGPFPGGPAPVGLPSQCAVGWDLAFTGGQFTATDPGSNCPPVDPTRLWLVDDGANGLLFPGSGKVYPTVTTGTAISPPFSFPVPGIPALQPNHAYYLAYVPAGVHPTAGQDASEVLQQALTISGPVTG
ncbi:hypothetical protein ACPPVO_13395 [Dactylosporangium sp. McL0621]|uniref:hypothetical protein n=1 Tax=Dactylosporangium sp. McL0621 TaxID=3415678 RepID=UPI003CF2940F